MFESIYTKNKDGKISKRLVNQESQNSLACEVAEKFEGEIEKSEEEVGIIRVARGFVIKN